MGGDTSSTYHHGGRSDTESNDQTTDSHLGQRVGSCLDNSANREEEAATRLLTLQTA